MKPWLKISILIAVIGIITAVAVYKYINKPNKDIEKATAEYSLNADNLYKEYTANKAMADSLYNEKVIEIKGNITKIEAPSDTFVVAVFTQKADAPTSKTEDLFSDLNAEGGIRCTMLQNHCDETRKITPGNPVRIKGLCKGIEGSDLILIKCSIVK